MVVFFLTTLCLALHGTIAEHTNTVHVSDKFVDDFYKLLNTLNSYKSKVDDVEAKLEALTEESVRKDKRIEALETELSSVKKLVTSSARDLGEWMLFEVNAFRAKFQ